MPAAQEESKRPHDTPFKQQKLKAWQPILTPFSVICTFIAISVVFIPIGAAILVASDSVIDVGPVRYDEDDGEYTFVSFTWPENTTDTVYMYYQLSNFYQNHRRYVKSRSDIQLAGSSLSDVEKKGDCSPWVDFDDHLPNTYDQINPKPEDLSSAMLNPCGLIANSQFNDTFALFEGVCTSLGECSSQPNISSRWTKEGIAWKSDKDKKFKNYEGWDGTPTVIQQADVEDEEFIVWMRTAGLPTFKKLHRIIDGGLQAGRYTMQIKQQFPVASFDGEKAFYLSTTTWIGGKNEFLGWAYIAVGAVCFILALAFFVKQLISPRKRGELTAGH